MLGIQSSTQGLGSLHQTQSLLAKAQEKLASGLQINRASDNAAGLAVAMELLGQYVGDLSASRNTQDAWSMYAVAEGALQNTNNDLVRMRELAVQANSDVLTAGDKAALQAEYSELAKNIDRTARYTEFNTKPLLSGNASGKVQTGANVGQTTDLGIGDMRLDALGLTGTDISSPGGADAALAAIDKAASQVSMQRAQIGGQMNGLESQQRSLANAGENQLAAYARIMDTDYARAMTDYSSLQLRFQAGLEAYKMRNINQPKAIMGLLA